MHLTTLDWAIMLAFFAIYLVIGWLVAKRVNQSYDSYFLGNRAMPWWLLGTSMVATTFATDTPNLVTGIVRQDGVFGNWVWWAFLLTGATTVFLYAKLWRRSEVLTDIEFYELRYSGKAAAFLRGFRAVYLGVFFNIIIMANVTLAAVKIGGVMLGLTPMQTILIASIVTVAYSMVGGLTGVLLTDLVQFIVAMVGSVWAAIYIVNLPEVGGLSQLMAHPEVVPHLSFFPDFSQDHWHVALAVFIIPLTVQWWSSYYPGAEPGGGGYVVQRMLAAKNEKHAVGATLMFNFMHYALRPWPWILVALASLIIFPNLEVLRAKFPHLPPNMVQNDLAYPAMLTFLPAGLLGIVVTSLIAAFMSTMSTQVNWGSSILVNDVYRRFMNPQASEKQLVWAGRWTTLGLMVVACALALQLQDALSSFNLLLQIGAGTGLLLMLRWFWWRVNAATEITAMVVSFVVAIVFFVLEKQKAAPPGWQQMLIGVGITTASWVIVAFLTPATDKATLRKFFKRIQPAGAGWNKVIAEAKSEGVELRDPAQRSDLSAALLATLAMTVGIYALIFAGGYLLYGRTGLGVAMTALALVCGGVLKACWPRLTMR